MYSTQITLIRLKVHRYMLFKNVKSYSSLRLFPIGVLTRFSLYIPWTDPLQYLEATAWTQFRMREHLFYSLFTKGLNSQTYQFKPLYFP